MTFRLIAVDLAGLSLAVTGVAAGASAAEHSGFGAGASVSAEKAGGGLLWQRIYATCDGAPAPGRDAKGGYIDQVSARLNADMRRLVGLQFRFSPDIKR